MSARALAARTGFKFTISIRRGPDKGSSYQLLPPTVTIGRSPDNNIVLSDPKVSRNAARIEFSIEQIIITDLSGRGGLTVNGESVSVAPIKDGDLIQLGETEFSFVVEALILAPPALATPNSHQPPGSFTTTRAGGQQFQQIRPGSANQGGSKMTFIIVLLVVGGFGAYLFSSSPTIKKPGHVLRTNDTVDKETKASTDRADEIIKKRTFKNDEEKTRFEEAQKQYLTGFRDYQKGQYMRAMREFETALAIDPDNQLARRYYKLAEKQRDESVSDLSLEGRRYKDKHMYSRCTAAFEKVLEQIPNKDDAKYKESDALRNECQLLENERFQ
jgi:pSer/pThr/pTyr-binding forkhead associated (FHA) protein